MSPLHLPARLRNGAGRASATPGVWGNLHPSCTTVAHWRDSSVLTPSPWYVESNPYGTWTQATLGTLTVTANTIASASVDFRTVGAASADQPMFVEFTAAGQAANIGIRVRITSISGDGRTLTLNGTPFTGATETSFTLRYGWGMKDAVSGGLPATPTMGTTRAIRTLSPAGVLGGRDPGRLMCSTPTSFTRLFFGAALQFPSDYPHTRVDGGGKYLFFNWANGERYFVNLDVNPGTVDGVAAAPGKFTIYRQSTRILASTLDWVPGGENKLEWEFVRGGAGADQMRLWLNGTLGLETTTLTFPTGNLASAQFTGSHNGNRYLTGSAPELYTMSTPYPGELRDAVHYATELYVASA